MNEKELPSTCDTTYRTPWDEPQVEVLRELSYVALVAVLGAPSTYSRTHYFSPVALEQMALLKSGHPSYSLNAAGFREAIKNL